MVSTQMAGGSLAAEPPPLLNLWLETFSVGRCPIYIEPIATLFAAVRAADVHSGSVLVAVT